jgi:hypothetical protein
MDVSFHPHWFESVKEKRLDVKGLFANAGRNHIAAGYRT